MLRGFAPQDALTKERCLEVRHVHRLTGGDTHHRLQFLTTATAEEAEGIEAEPEAALPIPILIPGISGLVFDRRYEDYVERNVTLNTRFLWGVVAGTVYAKNLVLFEAGEEVVPLPHVVDEAAQHLIGAAIGLQHLGDIEDKAVGVPLCLLYPSLAVQVLHLLSAEMPMRNSKERRKRRRGNYACFLQFGHYGVVQVTHT